MNEQSQSSSLQEANPAVLLAALTAAAISVVGVKNALGLTTTKEQQEFFKNITQDLDSQILKQQSILDYLGCVEECIGIFADFLQQILKEHTNGTV